MTTGYLEFKLIWIYGEKLIRISPDKDGARRDDYLNFDETLCFIVTLAHLEDTRNIVCKIKCIRNSSIQNEESKALLHYLDRSPYQLAIIYLINRVDLLHLLITAGILKEAKNRLNLKIDN